MEDVCGGGFGEFCEHTSATEDGVAGSATDIDCPVTRVANAHAGEQGRGRARDDTWKASPSAGAMLAIWVWPEPGGALLIELDASKSGQTGGFMSATAAPL